MHRCIVSADYFRESQKKKKKNRILLHIKYSVLYGFHYVTLLGKWSLNLTEELKYNLLCLMGSLKRFDFTRTLVILGASAVACEEPQKYLSVLGQCPWTQADSGTRVNLQWSGSCGEDSSGKQKGNSVTWENNSKVNQGDFFNHPFHFKYALGVFTWRYCETCNEMIKLKAFLQQCKNESSIF